MSRKNKIISHGQFEFHWAELFSERMREIHVQLKFKDKGLSKKVCSIAQLNEIKQKW